MSVLAFVASIVDSVAWPVVVVIVARMVVKAYRDSFE